VLIIVGLVLVSIAALFHVVVFVLESLRWTAPRTRAAFGIRSEEEARTTQLLAFNQGFYNLFLAAGTAAGVVLVLVARPPAVGYAVIDFGAGAMAAAGVVLAASQPKLLGAALLQFLPPALGLAALGLGTMH
jgi:putative membrane protein